MNFLRQNWVIDLRVAISTIMILAFMFYCAFFGEYELKHLKEQYGSFGTLGIILGAIICLMLLYSITIPNRKQAI